MTGPVTTPDAILAVLERHHGPLSAEQIAVALTSGGVVPRHGVGKLASAMYDRGLLRRRGRKYGLVAIFRRDEQGGWQAVGAARGLRPSVIA